MSSELSESTVILGWLPLRLVGERYRTVNLLWKIISVPNKSLFDIGSYNLILEFCVDLLVRMMANLITMKREILTGSVFFFPPQFVSASHQSHSAISTGIRDRQIKWVLLNLELQFFELVTMIFTVKVIYYTVFSTVKIEINNEHRSAKNSLKQAMIWGLHTVALHSIILSIYMCIYQITC